jgi:hypothetical protein
MSFITALALAYAAQAQAPIPPHLPSPKVILIPLDSRPAAGQFAQMIGKMASTDVETPPVAELGRFTTPGQADAVLDWLAEQDYTGVGAVVVSADMVTYGGLIASRTNDTPLKLAEERLARLAEIRRQHPSAPFYVFSSVMRLSPTATPSNGGWRAALAKYAELTERYARNKVGADFETLKTLEKQIPPRQIEEYEATRQRDHQIQVELVRMAAQGVFDYLTVGQDDARAYGPHVPETLHLHQLVSKLGIDGKVYFCEGIDQLSSLLVSRALLRESGWVPRVRVVYSDPDRSMAYAYYESKPINESLRDQIFASGARPVSDDGAPADYDLYVNVPGRGEASFREFLKNLDDELAQGFPVCVADINLGPDGTADPELFGEMMRKQRMMRLLAFAGWNTAGNSIGTAIPAANVYLLARKLDVDPLQREVAQREFLLHRFVNDYAYHKYTRPEAYRIIAETPHGNRELTGEPLLSEVEAFVRRDLEEHLEQFYNEEFQGQRFFAGTKEYEFDGLRDVHIFLPWPRAYEVQLEFSLSTRPAEVN